MAGSVIPPLRRWAEETHDKWVSKLLSERAKKGYPLFFKIMVAAVAWAMESTHPDDRARFRACMEKRDFAAALAVVKSKRGVARRILEWAATLPTRVRRAQLELADALVWMWLGQLEELSKHWDEVPPDLREARVESLARDRVLLGLLVSLLGHAGDDPVAKDEADRIISFMFEVDKDLGEKIIERLPKQTKFIDELLWRAALKAPDGWFARRAEPPEF